MSYHRSVINLLLKLGYTKNANGTCFGLSIRWMEAVFLEEQHVFDARIKQIHTEFGTILTNIKKFSEKKGTRLTSSDRQALDILSFCESTQLYHDPERYYRTYNEHLNQINIDKLSPYASSNKILELGGMVSVCSEMGIYTKAELIHYFDQISKIIDSVDLTVSRSIGILIWGINHTIALTYSTGLGWLFMDINKYPSISYPNNKIKKLVKAIGDSCRLPGIYRGLCIQVVALGAEPQLGLLAEKLAFFKQSHVLTEEIAFREAAGVNLSYFATLGGETELIKKLLRYGVDVKKVVSNGYSAINIAAWYGYFEIVQEFINSGVDVNTTTEKGLTPLMIAARTGYIDIIRQLIAHGADVDMLSIYGHTAFIIAAEHGYTEIVTLLSQYMVDLNLRNLDGSTPLFIAAQEGHFHTVLELIKLGLNERILFNASVEYYRAFARERHIQTIFRMEQFIAQHADNEGFIAMSAHDIAAIMGHKSTARLVHFYSVEKIKGLYKAIEQLKILAENRLVMDCSARRRHMGKKAFLLAHQFEELLKHYITHLYVSEDQHQINLVQTKFKATLRKGYYQLNERCGVWKPLWTNLAAAATDIGLLTNVAKYLSTNRNGFFNMSRSVEAQSAVIVPPSLS